MTVPLHELAYEVELKFRLAEDSDLDQLLSTVPVARGPVVDQCDTYLAHPGRDFAVTDEAFRIRSMGDDNRLTYKGPLVDRETKTRQEVEVPFESGGPARRAMLALLSSLGFRPVADVHKQRLCCHLTWEGRDVEIAVDTVERLGTFLELETLARNDDWNQARDALLRLAETLGLRDSERRSYLQLLLAESDQ